MQKTFSERVIEVVKAIPRGKITTYGHIAAFLGNKKGAIMVGWVLNKQKNNALIPAHRVVNRKGLLTGKMHFQGINLMQDLLESEGIRIEGNQVVNMEKYLWDPAKDL
jgi:methylated-DNA-protein-cysteine methyltransferase-like protein